MKQDKKSWLLVTRSVAKSFIEENYHKEASMFDIFWDSFSPQIFDQSDQPLENWMRPDATKEIVSEICFAKGAALDFVTPIVVLTVAETMSKFNNEDLSSAELQTVVKIAASRFGAGVELTKRLIERLPGFCKDVLSEEFDLDEAIVSRVSERQFEVWVNGDRKIVKSIAKYEAHKDNCLFWIDLNKKSHTSTLCPGKRLTRLPTELLRYLVEHLGAPVPIQNVLADVFEDEIRKSELSNDKRNKIEQQLTALDYFCEKQFRQYLFESWFKKGLGLRESFVDKYFLFTKLR